MFRTILLTVILYGILVTPGSAETSLIWEGKELQRGCELIIKVFSGEKVTEDDNNLSFYTNGYLAGFEQARDLAAGPLSEKKEICPPKNVYVIHKARVIVKHLNTHPEDLVRKPAEIVLSALREAYPCRQK